jgi:hypothetical protein
MEKPSVTRIPLTEDQLKLLKRMSPSTTDYDREYIRKRTGSATCVLCANFATYIATYDVGGCHPHRTILRYVCQDNPIKREHYETT